MKLKKLIENIKCDLYGDDVEILSLALSDADCGAGSLYFCIKGNNRNGADFIDSAIKKGAVAVIADEQVDCGVSCVVVKDVRKAMTLICKKFYAEPQKRMKTIGVVGTDGKTSVCEMVCAMLNFCGVKCGKIGTSGAEFQGKLTNTDMTTPDTPALYSIMDDMANNGAEAVCMELSAHAIYYKKADFTFDILIFTNCTRDHLDFFGTEEKYRAVKASAFTHKNCRLAVVNADDPLGIIIAAKRKSGTITYGIEQPSDVFALDINESRNGSRFLINLFDRLYDIESNLIGKFNVYNLLAVATASALCGLKTDMIARKLCELKAVEGRMQRVHEYPDVYVDYAHTPDGLTNALNALKQIACGKLFCVFGCGGNRDAGKRAEMGEISGRLADFSVVTCDNPRFEEAQNITGEIEKGVRTVPNSHYVTISDRKRAIEYALQCAKADDIVLIAGKGAEKYQEVMGVKLAFSDEETACAYFEKNGD